MRFALVFVVSFSFVTCAASASDELCTKENVAAANTAPKSVVITQKGEKYDPALITRQKPIPAAMFKRYGSETPPNK